MGNQLPRVKLKQRLIETQKNKTSARRLQVVPGSKAFEKVIP